MSQWAVWMYATKPGWERVGTFPTREDARETVRAAIDEGERPSGWAVVRRIGDPKPSRKPPHDAEPDLSDCPYYRGVPGGTCNRGCYSEPSCITDEPLNGWRGRAVKP